MRVRIAARNRLVSCRSTSDSSGVWNRRCTVCPTLFCEAFERYLHNLKFKKELDGWMRAQEWLISDDEQTARENVDRAVRLACYITANKLVFYQALRRSRRFKLPKLTVPSHIDAAERLRDHFRGMFDQAKIVTRDYQTIFDGDYH